MTEHPKDHESDELTERAVKAGHRILSSAKRTAARDKRARKAERGLESGKPVTVIDFDDQEYEGWLHVLDIEDKKVLELVVKGVDKAEEYSRMPCTISYSMISPLKGLQSSRAVEASKETIPYRIKGHFSYEIDDTGEIKEIPVPMRERPGGDRFITVQRGPRIETEKRLGFNPETASKERTWAYDKPDGDPGQQEPSEPPPPEFKMGS